MPWCFAVCSRVGDANARIAAILRAMQVRTDAANQTEPPTSHRPPTTNPSHRRMVVAERAGQGASSPSLHAVAPSPSPQQCAEKQSPGCAHCEALRSEVGSLRAVMSCVPHVFCVALCCGWNVTPAAAVAWVWVQIIHRLETTIDRSTSTSTQGRRPVRAQLLMSCCCDAWLAAWILAA